MSTETKYISRLKQLYNDSYKSELKSELKLDNISEVPVIEKVVLNVGLGRSQDDKRMFEVAANTLRKITGQEPVMTYARKSIAGFKLREGSKIGMKVTLRGDRMYEFLDRLINIVLPRLRDFHGVSEKAFDQQGNYSIGLKEQSVFAELSFEDVAVAHGLQITIITSADNSKSAHALLAKFGMPFRKTKEAK